MTLVDDDDLTIDPHAGQPEQVADTLRLLADEKLAEAERIRSAGRLTFAYVSTIFAIAQTVALSSFGADAVNPTERSVVVALGIAAIVALTATGFALLELDKLVTVPNPDEKTIKRQSDLAYEQGVPFSVRMAAVWSTVIRKRTAMNSAREQAQEDVTTGSKATLFLIGLEILVALIARLP